METSKEMIDELLPLVREGSFVLEPSAGYGAIALRLAQEKKCKVDCVELNHTNYLSLFIHLEHPLSVEPILNAVYEGDFLKMYFPADHYDYIVAVPPYKDNVDCQHIMKMYKLVKVGGTVLSYTIPHWVTGFYTNQVEFRNWLKDKNYRIKFVEDKSYMSCPKMLLIIQK